MADTPPSLGIRFNANSMLVIAMIGIVIKLFFSQSISEDGLSGPANAVIWGYGGSMIAIICLFFIVSAFYDKETILKLSNSKTLEPWLREIFADANTKDGGIHRQPINISIILFFIIILWTIIINVKYYKQINQGRVSLGYLNAEYVSTILLVFQVIVLFRLVFSLFSYTSNKIVIQSHNDDNNRMKFFTYLLSLINIILIGTATIDLVYFSTDG